MPPLPEKPIDLTSIRRKLFLMGLLRIPLIGFVRPRLISLTASTSEIKVNLKRRTKNHLGSMYFGAMMVGAELAAGVFVLNWMNRNKDKFTFVFSHADGDFFRRADSDVVFRCENGMEVIELFDRSRESGRRESAELRVSGFNSSNELIATFSFTLSVRVLH